MIALMNPHKAGAGAWKSDADRSPRSEPLADDVAASAWQSILNILALTGRLSRCCHAVRDFDF